MSRRERIFLALAVVHLGLVSLGAASYPIANLGRVISAYADFSGASSGYGFFATGVSSDIRAFFDVETRDGKKFTETLQRGKTHEGDLRVLNIIGKFWDEVDDEARRRALTASWAAKMYARHPQAKQVLVRVETFGFAPMGWEPYYTAKYVRR